MKVKSQKTAALMFTMGFALLASGCSNSKHHGSSGVAPAAEDEVIVDQRDDEQDANPTEEDYTAAYSVMNFRQLAAAYEKATGIPLQGNVLQEYERQLNSLPTDPDPTAVSASQVSSATKLAAVFCDELSQNQALRAEKFPSLDFNAPIANSQQFADIMLDTFFGPETTLQGDRPTDIATLAELTDYLNTVPNAQTPAIFMGACTAVLSSAEYYLY